MCVGVQVRLMCMYELKLGILQGRMLQDCVPAYICVGSGQVMCMRLSTLFCLGAHAVGVLAYMCVDNMLVLYGCFRAVKA